MKGRAETNAEEQSTAKSSAERRATRRTAQRDESRTEAQRCRRTKAQKLKPAEFRVERKKKKH